MRQNLKMRQNLILVSLMVLVSIVSAGLVKRDVQEGFSNMMESAKDALGDVGNDIDNLDETKYCVKNTNCMEPFQKCDTTEYKLYGTCEIEMWVWIAGGALVFLIFFSCITSIVCCCCSSLCRKAT